MNDDAKSWGDFWANNADKTDGEGPSGCLPERWSAIEDAQKAAWSGFIADLTEGARILDLATGDGRVLRWMRDERGDLSLTGIDLAPTLPPAPNGTETRGSVAMEDLPFEDNAFDAVVSQFGFEYGDSAKVAAEIARVLSPGGKVALMVHRGDGPILEHNRNRAAAIDWAIEQTNVTGAVSKALQTPGAGPAIAAQVAAALAKLGASKFGETSPAWEIPEALRRACLMGESQGTASILETMEVIKERAENEIGRINSLARACVTADARDNLVEAFAANGHSLAATNEVSEPSGRAFADFLTFN